MDEIERRLAVDEEELNKLKGDIVDALEAAIQFVADHRDF